MPSKHQPLRLNLGAGFQPYTGYLSVDTHPYADVRHDLRDPLPFADESVDEIFASHVLEHFPLWQIQEILVDWNRVLKSRTGFFWGYVPNGPVIAQKYLDSVAAGDKQSKLVWLANFHGGFTNNRHIGDGQTHHALYDRDLLQETLSRGRFHPVTVLEADMGPDNHALVFICGKALYQPMPIAATGFQPKLQDGVFTYYSPLPEGSIRP